MDTKAFLSGLFLCLHAIVAQAYSVPIEGVVQCNCQTYNVTVYGYSGGQGFSGSRGGFTSFIAPDVHLIGGHNPAYDSGEGAFDFHNSSMIRGVVFLRKVLAASRQLIADAQTLSGSVLSKTRANRLHSHIRARDLRKRGWTEEEIEQLLKDPAAVSTSNNGRSIVYWKNRRDHIVVTKDSAKVIQVSNRRGAWRLDSRINDPYRILYGEYPEYAPIPSPNDFINNDYNHFEPNTHAGIF
jgi:hypothetical protein